MSAGVGRLVAAVDGWQRRNRVAGPTYGVVKKFGDDDANLFVVALGWYGFTAIYPLILVVVTILGYIGVESLGKGVVDTLHQFPVIGQQFNPAAGSANLHGSIPALVVGLVGLVYGAQGVTQVAQQAAGRVWNQPPTEVPGFVPRLVRSLAALATIGGAFLLNAFASSLAAGIGRPLWARILIVVGMLVVNTGLYLLSFRILTAVDVGVRQLVPGAVLASVGFTVLITVGAGLVQHQLRHSSATYGALGSVIGVVTFLLLLAKITMYALELNPVLARGLWPRGLTADTPTEADEQVLRDRAKEARARDDERIGVGFGDDAPDEAAADARHDS